MTSKLTAPLLLATVHAGAFAAPERVMEAPNAVVAITGKELEKLSASRDLAGVLARLPCGRQTVPTFLPPPANNPAGASSLTCVRPDDIRMVDVLREHNRARAAFGSQPLVWDLDLARGASFYAAQMPARGLVHSPRDSRPRDVRENLQKGLRGQSGVGMTSIWVGESRLFMPGVFPNVSRNGDWASVAHYTQMVWPTTTRVGCGAFPDRQFEWVVCRYSPPGNRDGTVIAPLPPMVMTIAEGSAPANSSTPIPPLGLPKLPIGGGMTQIDPPPGPPPPPPPPPTARDPAPDGDEARHPLRNYFMTALDDHRKALNDGYLNGQADALARMHYALQELLKRLRTARKLGGTGIPGVKPADIQKLIDDLNKLYREANEASRPRPAPRQSVEGEERG